MPASRFLHDYAIHAITARDFVSSFICLRSDARNSQVVTFCSRIAHCVTFACNSLVTLLKYARIDLRDCQTTIAIRWRLQNRNVHWQFYIAEKFALLCFQLQGLYTVLLVAHQASRHAPLHWRCK